MVDPSAPPERLPRASAPKGWRHARRRRQRTFDEDFPTLGMKLRFIAAAGGSLLLMGLALLAITVGGWYLAADDITDLTENAATELGYGIVLMGAGIFLAIVAGIDFAIHGALEHGREAKEEGAAEGGMIRVAARASSAKSGMEIAEMLLRMSLRSSGLLVAAAQPILRASASPEACACA